MTAITKLIPIIAALAFALCASAQTIDLRKLPKAEREKYLIELSLEIVMTYGPDFYDKGVKPIITEKTFSNEDPRTLINQHNGRRYYEVAFPYDTQVEWVKKFNAAAVEIWCDTGESLGVTLGMSGYAFFDYPFVKTKTRTDFRRPKMKRTFYPPKE